MGDSFTSVHASLPGRSVRTIRRILTWSLQPQTVEFRFLFGFPFPWVFQLSFVAPRLFGKHPHQALSGRQYIGLSVEYGVSEGLLGIHQAPALLAERLQEIVQKESTRQVVMDEQCMRHTAS